MCDTASPKAGSVFGGPVAEKQYQANQSRLGRLGLATDSRSNQPTAFELDQRMENANTELSKLHQLRQLLDSASLAPREILLMLELLRDLGYRI